MKTYVSSATLLELEEALLEPERKLLSNTVIEVPDGWVAIYLPLERRLSLGQLDVALQ